MSGTPRVEQDRWRRVDATCREALEREGQDRAAWLDEIGAADPELRQEVQALLEGEADVNTFLETDALNLAAHTLKSEPVVGLIGRRIGPYTIEAWLGSGGMGDVYRARDTNLHRDVALKILPELFVGDPDRLARFRREAQILASLDHPNIAVIHGFESNAGIVALVLELVEGPTLADRIASGPIPVSQAFAIARQIAEGLEAAHEQGVMHRDLKPANIKLRPDGTVKLLDFGLAEVFQSPAESLAAGATQESRKPIAGTAAYISPEQVEGLPSDKRSDIWAFGTVFYEMLTGRAVFTGARPPQVITSVLHDPIDWSFLPQSLPTDARWLIERCLDRDVRSRLRDIGEARIALVRVAEPSSTAHSSGLTRTNYQTRAARRLLAASVTVVVTGFTAAGVWALLRGSTPVPSPIIRFPLDLPTEQRFTVPLARHAIALSPDGTQLVYTANNRLYLRSMSELTSRVIEGSDGYQRAMNPVVSPDGQSVAFFARSDRTLKRLPITGGSASTLGPVESPLGITWDPYGLLVGQGGRGIVRVPATGGEPSTIVHVEEGEEAHGPQLLPDGEHVLFTLARGHDPARWDRARIVVQSLRSGVRKTVVEGGSDARLLSNGQLLYAVGSSVMAIDFDSKRLEVRGEPAIVVDGVRRAAAGETGTAQLTVSSTGSLAFIPGPASPFERALRLRLAIIDRHGVTRLLTLPAAPYGPPRVSPEGARVAFELDDGKETAIYSYDLSGRGAMQKIISGGRNRFPVWSADGRWIAFQSDSNGEAAIYRRLADGSGRAEQLTTPATGESHMPEAWVPNHDALLFSVSKGSEVALWSVSLEDRVATPYGNVHSSFPTSARVSPDGQWIAYTVMVRGTSTIYVQPFPATGASYPLVVSGTNNTPHKAAWAADGRELFYVPRVGEFEVVPVRTRPRFAFGAPSVLPRPFLPGPPSMPSMYDVTRTGEFVGLVDDGQSGLGSPPFEFRQMQVVFNWFTELRKPEPTIVR